MCTFRGTLLSLLIFILVVYGLFGLFVLLVRSRVGWVKEWIINKPPSHSNLTHLDNTYENGPLWEIGNEFEEDPLLMDNKMNDKRKIKRGSQNAFQLSHIFAPSLQIGEPNLHIDLKNMSASNVMNINAMSSLLEAANDVIYLDDDYRTVPLLRVNNLGDYDVDSAMHSSMNDNLSIKVPRVTYKRTVEALARLSSNAYLRGNSTDDWLDTPPWENIGDFGWDRHGLRGHIYTNTDESVVIVAIKGTSTTLFGRNGSTGALDKFHDNMMFSCCCAKIDFTWSPVCSCHAGGYNCSRTCLSQAVRDPQSYLRLALKITRSVRSYYPKATLWFVGHSLGGALSSLLSILHPGSSAVSFAAPGEVLYAKRLGLITSADELLLGRLPIFHFGHTSDPVFFGRCVGKLSPCYHAGYALETQCHLGNVCIFDRGTERFDIGKHRIGFFISKVIPEAKSVPLCKPQLACVDCPLWNYM